MTRRKTEEKDKKNKKIKKKFYRTLTLRFTCHHLSPVTVKDLKMLKIARLEKLAQRYVALCGDEVAAYREAYPEISDGKTPAKIKKLFATLTSKDAAFWRRVANLQKPIEEKIQLDAIGVFSEWSKTALTDTANITSVRTIPPQPHCEGETGEGKTCSICGEWRAPTKYVHVADTAELTPDERRMFISAEQTKNGIKVNLRDPDAALNNIAKALGMFAERLLISDNVELPPLPTDKAEAVNVYNRFVKGTK